MNRLATETSPYLRQHRDNPVDWFPWGPEAFEEARRRGVPILLSVGYSACHWCHVMAHECFEDAETAHTMNRLFVNVKVDREERPDVDAVYMDAVQAMTGRGGWPMTVFLTPAGEPFYGGTYFPKPNFLQLMTAIDDVWRTRPADIRQNVDALVEALGRSTRLAPAADVPPIDLVPTALGHIADQFDAEWGGFGGAPKFPSTMTLDLFVRTVALGLDHEGTASNIVDTSLAAMASGGMYDHIGGGFARYSVDQQWLVPHFEKMLYDQALLVRLYAHATSAFANPVYAQVVDETIGYVLRDLRHPDGGFYSAEDADSPDEHGHGHEGLFHTWTTAEVRDVLSDDAHVALDWYEFTDTGNFEGRTIPSRLRHRGDLLRPAAVEHARQRLFAARERRRRPGLDDKVVTEWNALMLASLSEAAALFGRADWAQAAIANGEFLVRELRTTDGRWMRTWHPDGRPKARHMALAADHAALIDAFTRLGELTGEARWTTLAVEVADTLLLHFWDHESGGVFTTADDGEQLVVRQKDLLDNATPGANSSTALAFLRLAALTGEQRFGHHADQILRLLASTMQQAPSAFAQALGALWMRHAGFTEVVVSGDRPDLVSTVQRRWWPHLVLAWGQPFGGPLWEGRTDVAGGAAFVCTHHVCALPSTTVAALLTELGAPEARN